MPRRNQPDPPDQNPGPAPWRIQIEQANHVIPEWPDHPPAEPQPVNVDLENERVQLVPRLRPWRAEPIAVDWDHIMPWFDQKNKGKRGEELFQLILSGIREIYDVEAVIAGGAVRDVAAGATNHKDVDVFIPITVKKFMEGLEELGWQGPFKQEPKPVYPVGEADKKMPGCMFPTLGRCSHKVQNCPVDLIFLKEPLSKENLETFPVFAQRAVWTLDEGLVLSPEARKDIELKQFTIDPAITDKDRVKAVKGKIEGWKKRDTYKDWNIIEPVIPEWWEDVKKGN